MLHEAIHETDVDLKTLSAWKGLSRERKLSSPFREAFERAGYRFGHAMPILIGCPSCPKGLTPSADLAALGEVLAFMLDDDPDGIAATLEDLI